MQNYSIIIDSATDLPLDLIKKYNLTLLGLKCQFKNKEYVEDENMLLTYEDFYKAIRQGECPTTSQVNSFSFYEAFEKLIKEGKSIIYPAFSSALSGTINSARIAKDDILEKYPDADITIIDTKCASLGNGLLIIKACMLKEQGATKEEVINYLSRTAPNINHLVLLDDLVFLKRGGRLSGTAALVGSILQVKPLVKMNDNGELINYSKIKGRKKSIHYLFSQFEEKAIDIDKQEVIAISHSDCEEDAKKLAEMITSKYDVKVIINYIGCVIGSHTGPNTIALFFVGNGR